MNFTAAKEVIKLNKIYSDTQKGRGVNCSDLNALLTTALFGTNLSETVKLAPWTRSESSIGRSVKNINIDALMTKHQSRILSKLKKSMEEDPARFMYIIDDTPNEKDGKLLKKCGRHCSHKNKMYRGQRIIMLCIYDKKTGKNYPIAYDYCLNKDDAEHVKSTDLMIKLLQRALDMGFPPTTCVTDSWFNSSEIVMKVRGMGFKFCGEFKLNRTVKIEGNDRWLNLKKASAELMKQKITKKKIVTSKAKPRNKRGKIKREKFIYIQEFEGKVKKCGVTLKFILVFKHSNSKKPEAIYATTDLTLDGAHIWKAGRERWNIESTFRDLKQNLFFGRLSLQGQVGADLAICLPMVLYSSLQMDAFWGEFPENYTLGQKIESIRKRELIKSTEFIKKNPKSRKIDLYLNRNSRIKRKPVNQAISQCLVKVMHAA